MPLFFFHLRKRDCLERDDIGVECADLDVAYLQACETIPDLSADLLREGHDPMACAFEISSGNGMLLMQVPFDERVRRRRRPSPSAFAAVARMEQTMRLLADVQEQHASIWHQIAGMRELLTRTAKDSSPI